mgnify:CR=1 FL=1
MYNHPPHVLIISYPEAYVSLTSAQYGAYKFTVASLETGVVPLNPRLPKEPHNLVL